MKDEEIYNIWTQFINDPKYVNILNLMKKFGKKLFQNL